MGIIQKTTGFLKEVRVESTKVTWPTRKELKDSTMVVIVTVFIVSIFVGVVDRVLSAFLGFIVR